MKPRASSAPGAIRRAAFAVATLAFAAFLAADVAWAQEAPGQPGYTGPELEIPIPGVEFSGIIRNDGKITVPWLAQYIGGVYTFLISIVGAVAAAVMIVGGFQYVTSAGDSSKLGKAKKRIVDAMIGLLLAFGSYTILYAINPELTEFRGLQIAGVHTELYPFETGVPDELVTMTPTPTANIRSGKLARFCDMAPGTRKRTTDCVPVCKSWGCGTAISENNCDFSKMPKEPEGAINPDSGELIPSSRWPAMKNIKPRSKGVKATQAVIEGLQRADKYIDANYAGQALTVQVNNCWRDWRGDAAKECGIILGDHNIRAGSPIDHDPNNYGLAWPGVGPHSSGAACDMILFREGKQISGIKGAQQSCLSMKAGNELFVDIMTNQTVGAKRLNFEAWHFEWGGPTGCRCTGQACKNIWTIKIPNCSAAGGTGLAC